MKAKKLFKKKVMKAKSYDREKNIQAREVTKSKRELQQYRQKEKKVRNHPFKKVIFCVKNRKQARGLHRKGRKYAF